MADFNYGAFLLDVVLHGTIKDLFEEVLIRVELESQRKFVLEAFPDLVVLPVILRRPQAHFVLQPIVKFLCVLPVVAQLCYWHVPWHVEILFSAHLEEVFLLGIPNTPIIG